jgi:glycosyltransferase involved in cell wall biosynthesis
VYESRKEFTVFVVVGRLGKSLTVSKVVPFTTHPTVQKLFIFREDQGKWVEGAKYVTLESFLSNFGQGFLKKIARVFCEPIQLIFHARRQKPFLINGVFTLPKGLNAVIAAKLSGTKSVVSVIGGTVEITTRMKGRWFWEKINLWVLAQSDAVTTKGSKITAWLIEQGIPSEKIFNLNGSIDVDRFKPVLGMERDIDILFVGNFSNLKGPDRVFQVIQNLVLEGKEIKAVFLGEGHMYAELKEKINENGLKQYISLEGYRDNTVTYFQRAKMLMMPSTSEGLPTAMLEAMASGCVPVISNVGNVTDAAKHEENALVIENWNDIKAFTTAAKRLISDAQFRERLSQEGRKTVESSYTPEKQAEVVDRLLNYLKQKT